MAEPCLRCRDTQMRVLAHVTLPVLVAGQIVIADSLPIVVPCRCAFDNAMRRGAPMMRGQ